jgi:hypothetical protein
MGKPSPHGALGIDGGAPAPPLEMLPPEPPLDAELLVPLPVVVLGDAPVSLQYVGSWVPHFVGQSTILTLTGDRATGEALLAVTAQSWTRV